jgi:hypothetical protein
VVFPTITYKSSNGRLRGFAAKASAKVLDTVQTMGNDYHAVIEEDQMVSIVGGSS